MKTRYAIKKNGKYMGELFPITFKATTTRDAYIYNVKQIAQDIASTQGGEIEEVTT